MNKLLCFIILLLFGSCAKENTEEPYIILSEYEVRTSADGVEVKIQISSNCQWYISNVPQWCVVNINSGEFNTALQLKIASNNTNSKRESFIKIASNEVTKYLLIEQDRLFQNENLKWFTFSVNTFTAVNYIIVDDEAKRIYTIKGTKNFIASSAKSKIYLGNIINKISENLLSFIDYPEYTYNPVTIGSFVDGKAYIKTVNKPSLSELDILANEIIQNKQNQILNFNFDDTPISYNSHKQLYLLGEGNLGVDLGRVISGYSYNDKEMVRQTGLVYSYCNTLFNITMDIPDKLVDEVITDHNLAYISNLNYGRIGFLIVESDSDYNLLIRTVKKVMKEKELNKEESLIIEQSSIYYLSLNSNGDIIKKEGKVEIIRDYIASINESDIVPLSFSISNCMDNHIEEIEYKVSLP